MNEQQQAESLAAWLAGGGPPPEGLDDDVVETVVALRPELAAPARVSADDILATVTEGPLARTGGPPVGASLAPELAVPEPSNRPWIFALLGAGGLSSLALAAVALFAVTVTFSDPELAPAPAAQTVRTEEAVQSDSGMPKGDARVQERSVRKASSRPRPKPRPIRRPAPVPATVHSAAEPAASAEVLDDAVAFADEEAPEADFDEGFALDPPNASLAAPASRARRLEEPVIPEAMEPAPLDYEAPDHEAAKPATGGAYGGSAGPPASPPAQAAPSRDDDALGAAEERSVALAPAREESKKRESADLDALSKRAHRGTGRASHPRIDEARAALAAGTPQSAVVAAQAGLAQLSGDTAERQLLYALLGDARLALGDAAGAQRAWTTAEGIRQAR